MIRLTSQRGISLLLLVIVITVFAGVAIGLVSLLRPRHESYPYQVQSYQAYALAHAGIEFAVQYAKENPQTYQNVFPADYDISGTYGLGNGQFKLKYSPGCPDLLYSNGTCGLATREVRIDNFSLFAGIASNSVYKSSAVTRVEYTSAFIFSGSRIEFTFCDPSRLTPTGIGNWSFIKKDSITIAATKPISIMRVGPTMPGGGYYQWVWDAMCSLSNCGNEVTLGVWDGISDPPTDADGNPVGFTPTWNVWNPLDLVNDNGCRPRSCPDNNICPIYPGTSRTIANCGTVMQRTFNMRDLFFGNWQGHVAIETRGTITTQTPVTFYVAFDHAKSVALAAPPFNGGATDWVRNKFIFTVN